MSKMETKHTPGPWFFLKKGSNLIPSGSELRKVYRIFGIPVFSVKLVQVTHYNKQNKE